MSVHAPLPSTSTLPPSQGPEYPQERGSDYYFCYSRPTSPSPYSRPTSPARPRLPERERPESRSERLLRATLARADAQLSAPSTPAKERGTNRKPQRADGLPYSLYACALSDDEDEDCDSTPSRSRSRSHSPSPYREDVPLPHTAPLPLGRSHSFRVAVSPHEAVLRARLERVLGGMGVGLERRGSMSHGSLSRSSGSSEEELSNGKAKLPLTPPPTPPHHSAPLQRRESLPRSRPSHSRTRSLTQPSSSTHSAFSIPSHPDAPSPRPRAHNSDPAPAPCTPQEAFDARAASATCRAQAGYVSFASVKGLGSPPGLEEEADDAGEGRDKRWWRRWS